MAQLAIVVDVNAIEDTAERLLRVGVGRINSIAQKAVNEVADRAYEDSVKRLTSRVNITPDRVRKDMTVEHGTDPAKAEATIIAFRDGGRRRMRPVNLRQYNARQLVTVNNWSNAGVATNSGLQVFSSGVGGRVAPRKGVGPNPRANGIYENPRKPGSKLPFIPRTGAPHLGIPLGQKQHGLTVEVLKGGPQPITYAFLAMSRNNGMLVFKREKGDHKGKGKMVSMHSLSVWQMFRKTSAEIIPFVRDDLNKTVLADLDEELKGIL